MSKTFWMGVGLLLACPPLFAAAWDAHGGLAIMYAGYGWLAFFAAIPLIIGGSLHHD